MILHSCLLAATSVDDLFPPSTRSSASTAPLFFQVMILLGTVGVLTVILVCWAVYFRKRKKESSRSVAPLVLVEEEESPTGNLRRKFKKRRREHKPRNPTLAETGGLPPAKTDKTDQSSL